MGLWCARQHVILAFISGKQVQTRFSERTYSDVGAEHYHNQKKLRGRYPQESYTTVVCTIQSEWIFVQQIPTDTGDTFAWVEKMIRETFFSPLLLKKTKSISPIEGDLSIMPVKKYELGLLNALTSANKKCISLQLGSAELIQSMTRGGGFSKYDHLLALREERRERQKNGMTLITPNSRV